MQRPEKTEILDAREIVIGLVQAERELLRCYGAALGEGLTRSMREAILECMSDAADSVSALLEEKNFLLGDESASGEDFAEKLYKDVEKMQKKLIKTEC